MFLKRHLKCRSWVSRILSIYKKSRVTIPSSQTISSARRTAARSIRSNPLTAHRLISLRANQPSFFAKSIKDASTAVVHCCKCIPHMPAPAVGIGPLLWLGVPWQEKQKRPGPPPLHNLDRHAFFLGFAMQGNEIRRWRKWGRKAIHCTSAITSFGEISKLLHLPHLAGHIARVPGHNAIGATKRFPIWRSTQAPFQGRSYVLGQL
jgi:hypothetical protein